MCGVMAGNICGMRLPVYIESIECVLSGAAFLPLYIAALTEKNVDGFNIAPLAVGTVQLSASSLKGKESVIKSPGRRALLISHKIMQ
jgi:hypothetical protein